MPQNFKAQWSDYAKPGPYITPLQPNEEKQFQSWVKQNKIPWQDSTNSDYDMRGFWKAQQLGDPNAVRAANLHFPDTYKTPYHKTFSNESKYALPTAGHWEGQTFIAPNVIGATQGLPQPERYIPPGLRVLPMKLSQLMDPQ